MAQYQFDAERWLRSQASLYRACHNRDLEGNFVKAADEIKGLKEEVAELMTALVGEEK